MHVHSRVLRNLSQGLPTLGSALHLIDPTVFEMASLMGIEAIWLDLEHHPTSVETAANLIRAARVGGTDVVARPANGEFARMARLLEAGARGIMYPRCASADEAREVVRWAKFAPVGERGFDGSGPDVPFLLTPMTQYLQQANRETFLIIQIESQGALDQIEQIAAVPGIDFLMLGPADFSILSGIPGEFQNPRIRSALERVATAAQQAGIHWAATCGSLEQAQEYVEMGAKLVFHGCDLVAIFQEFQRVVDGFKKFRPSVESVHQNQNGSSYLAQT